MEKIETIQLGDLGNETFISDFKFWVSNAQKDEL